MHVRTKPSGIATDTVKQRFEQWMKQTETALADGNVETAEELCKTTVSLLDRAASKGVIKKGTANRQKSRLIRKLHALTAAA